MDNQNYLQVFVDTDNPTAFDQTGREELEEVFAHLSQDDKEQIAIIIRAIDLNDPEQALNFGSQVQRELADFADTILQRLKSDQAGQAGHILRDLLDKIRQLDIGSLNGEGSFIKSIPVVGSLFDSAKRFMSRFEKVESQIEQIGGELEKARLMLLKDVSLLEKLFGQNLNYLHKLELHIAAGQLKLARVTNPIVSADTDPIASQRRHDHNQNLDRFAKRLHDLKLSRMLAVQSLPQVRLIQNNNKLLAEKIQSSLLNTIPLWKNQIVLAVTMLRQQKALKLQQQVTDTTNKLLEANSELLKQTSLETAQAAERGIVDLQTLKKINTDLITTLEETLKIQQEGRLSRLAAEDELLKMEHDLKNRLKSSKLFSSAQGNSIIDKTE